MDKVYRTDLRTNQRFKQHDKHGNHNFEFKNKCIKYYLYIGSDSENKKNMRLKCSLI